MGDSARLPAARPTARELIERWTPGLLGDGSELALVLAVESTAELIRNGAIAQSADAKVFMDWYADHFSTRAD